MATLTTELSATNPDVTWAVEDIKANLPRRQKALDYYEGRHPLNFTSAKFQNTFGEQFAELRDNLCDDVVDEPTNRLQIIGWTGEQSKGAQEWWEQQRGDARAGAIAQHSFRSGDGFAIVWDANGDGLARMYVQDPRQMAIRYSASEPDRPEVAAKCWREGKGYRLNLYYPAKLNRPGRIEHYYSKGYDSTGGEKGIPSAKAFRPFVQAEVLDGSGQVVEPPVDWYEEHEHDFPVFHFPNGDLGAYGQSVLRDVYPLQDAGNKVLCDFMVSGEANALPKRFFSGLQAERDPVTGQELPLFDEKKNNWWTGAKRGDVEATQFTLPDVEMFLKSMDAITLKIARKGGLPPHAVNLWQGNASDAPSGLSLLLAEGKIVKMLKDRQRDWGVVWRNLVAYALNFTTSPGTSDSTTVTPEWAPPETRDEKGLWETIVLKKAAVGSVVPDSQFAQEGGYTEKELESFVALKEEETARKMDQAQAAMGGRISTAGPASPGLAPGTPAPPAGAATATPGGGA